MNIDHKRLATIAAEIDIALHSETWRGCHGSSIENPPLSVIHVGSLLIEARSQIQHGEWQQWMEKNFTLSDGSARLYMRAAKYEWADRLLKKAGLTEQIEHANSIDDLVLIDFEHFDMTLHYANSRLPLFLRAHELKKVLKKRFNDLKNLRKQPTAPGCR
jgi:hypothetical protein